MSPIAEVAEADTPSAISVKAIGKPSMMKTTNRPSMSTPSSGLPMPSIDVQHRPCPRLLERRFVCSASSSMILSSSSTSCRRCGHSPVAQADDAAEDLDDALHTISTPDDRDQRLEWIDRRPVRAESRSARSIIHDELGESRSPHRRRRACRGRRTGSRARGPARPACAAARRGRGSRRAHGRCATAHRRPPS